MMQSNGIRPRRMLVPQQETSKESNMKPHSAIDAKKSKEDILQGHRLMAPFVSPRPPSLSLETIRRMHQLLHLQNGVRLSGINDAVASSGVKPEKVLAEVRRKVHFSTEKIATSQGAHDRMATRTDDLLSHMDSLALAEWNGMWEIKWILQQLPIEIGSIRIFKGWK
ncbi:UNVERIFIED_CONTAM: hypothetical protein Sradi_3703100 [Sesamum radiatum]|uniref:Uncharacterized protein n=1 Tax=Sesamum radiatum TaxID=300843 RepID=A0AAW2PXP1_SESRA